MKREKLFYPPNSFESVSHWRVLTLRVDGTYRTYTEHATKGCAVTQMERMALRYPSHQLKLVHVTF